VLFRSDGLDGWLAKRFGWSSPLGRFLDPLADKILLMTNGPRARIAEIVENTLPKERSRTDLHKHPNYYPLRNHLIDFLVTRSRELAGGAGALPGASRQPPVIRPTSAGASQTQAPDTEKPSGDLPGKRPPGHQSAA